MVKCIFVGLLTNPWKHKNKLCQAQPEAGLKNIIDEQEEMQFKCKQQQNKATDQGRFQGGGAQGHGPPNRPRF